MRTYIKVFEKVKDNTVKQEDFEKLRLSRPGIEGNLKKLRKIVGIANITLHMLRHTSATLCSKKGFNEMELRIRYSWSRTSKMPSRYVHLAVADLDDKIKVIPGFIEPDEQEKSKLITVVCWNCSEENVPTNKYCGRCDSNLKPKKEQLISTATDIGIAIQKSMSKDDIMEKELQELKEK